MIAQLRDKVRPLEFATYDLEWYPDTLELRLIGLLVADRFHVFLTVEEFFAFILTPRFAGMNFFAHYGGRFDIVHLFEPLLRAGYKVEAMFSGSSAVRVVVEHGRHRWTFADSQFLFKVGLAELGRSVGLAKLDCAFDAPIAELITYNERDCRILTVALEKAAGLMSSLGGKLCYTLASTALDLFRRVYLGEDIPTQKTINDLIRPAYVSSRVEVIRARSDHGYYCDINSSFPWSMQVAPLPGRLLRIDREIGPMSVFRASIRVPESYIPPLPYRYGGSIYFPTGEWEGWFSAPDAELLEEMGGTIVKVHESYHFAPQTYLADYVNSIYPMRVRETDPFWKFFLKILLNALYGKMGEREEKERIVLNPASTSCPHKGEHVVKGVSQCMRMLRAGVWAIKDVREVAHAHLPIPIVTTSRSRAAITRHCWKADRLAYLDTDGIFSATSFPSSSELGGLKLEWEYTDGSFAVPKGYAVKAKVSASAKPCSYCREVRGDHDCDVVRLKGFPRMSRSDFDGLLAGGSVQTELFRGPKTALRKGMGQDIIPKAFSRACVICGAYVGDRCPQHGDRVRVYPRSRPKRSTDGEASRPWSIKEIHSEWS